MSFGNAAIFPYPAVQYIPLEVTVIHQGDLDTLRTLTLPTQLIIGNDLLKWKEHLAEEYRITLPEEFAKASLPFLALNLKIGTVKYRGYFITMTGQKIPGYYQLFTLPRRYFYKNNLYFEVFDELTSKCLTKCSLFLPDISH